MNAAPVLVGFAAVLVLAFTLVLREPSPGVLAEAHSEIGSSLESCALCHTPTGLDAGCLACHHKIQEQIDTGGGFHVERASDCAQCHPDHHGSAFDVMEAIAWGQEGRGAFLHDHVEFRLSERHDELTCRECHRGSGTFLGLQQECASCHEDVHGGDLFRDCAQCHDQARFKPASRFDHGKSFPLLGRHAEAACDRCHGGLEYREVKGKQCRSCHDSPHRFESKAGCEECHGAADFSWTAGQSKFDAQRHAETGFELSTPHVKLACAECHTPELPYETRFELPTRQADNCRGCHEDVHRGQFGDVTCTNCHTESSFRPAQYGLEQHTSFVLRESHRGAECHACHKESRGARRFVGTPRKCAECHEDPHAGQFPGACTTCHGERSFKPAHYSVANHRGFPLTGAHGAVACNSCHTVVDGVRRFRATPQACAECHQNPHGTQFAREIKQKGCEACHDTTRFRIPQFDHDARTSYPLKGEHREADCARCHRASGQPPVRRYRGTEQSCASCHRDEHRGQFADRSCDRCHSGFREWEIRSFDHARTRFPLDGRHRRISCDDCHPEVRQRDGHEVVQYRPLGRECKDCHEVERR